MRRRNYRQTRENYGRGNRRDFERRNWGSARSDYGEHAYGGNLNDEGMEGGQGWWDEMSSWFEGGEEDNRRRGDYDRSNRNYSQRENRDRRSDNMRAFNVMTRDVSTVSGRDSVQYAARIMRDEDCGALPVVNGYGQLLGMITDRDITVRLVASGYDTNHALVMDCMTEEAFACHAEDSVRECMSVMSRHQIRRLPIVDDHDRVIGIVSQADLARCFDNRSGRGKRRFTEMMDEISEPTSDAYS